MREFELPEFTRSLRALAVPSAPGSDHDKIFAPLITARTTAHRVQGIDGQVAALDAVRLEREWRAALAALVAGRFPRSASDRRALEAELDQLGAPLWSALLRLQEAAVRVKAAAVADRRVHWERWVVSVQRVFDAADDWWRLSLPVLATAHERRAGVLRRLFRRSR